MTVAHLVISQHYQEIRHLVDECPVQAVSMDLASKLLEAQIGGGEQLSFVLDMQRVEPKPDDKSDGQTDGHNVAKSEPTNEAASDANDPNDVMTDPSLTPPERSRTAAQ